MERTRDEILGLLQLREYSVAELSSAIGVSEGSIRRHLDLMAAEGLVQARLERQQRGRPVSRYSLTEAGEEHGSSTHYARLLDRMLPALTGLTAEEVGGLEGAALLGRVFDELATLRARQHAPHVRSERIEERIEQVTRTLREEGILSESEEADGGFRLRNDGCPYRSCATDHHVACDADRRTIELLLGMPVLQVSTVAAGGSSCEYLVSTEQAEDDGSTHQAPPAPVA